MKNKLKFDWKKIGVVSLAINLVLGIVIGGGLVKKDKEVGTRVVTRVIDGDTVDFSDATHGRLIGIDAPEYPKGCLSKQAKARLEELVLGKEVKVKLTGKRSFERDLVWISFNGVSVNKVMVEEGMATKDKGYTDEMEIAESEARVTKRGIWSSQCTSEQEGCLIKGNYHKGTKDKVYHMPDCYNYDQVVINPNESDRWFCTEAEAKKAGFLKSKDCPGMK
jgi:endonuclease YncB( thermonuclease family)